jgi:predicted small secreted protein
MRKRGWCVAWGMRLNQGMNSKLKRSVFAVLLLTMVSAFALSGCHTANGFGKDMSEAGGDIQKETK